MSATITNGFTNTGRLEFRTLDAFYGNQLTVTNGTLVNAAGGTLDLLYQQAAGVRWRTVAAGTVNGAAGLEMVTETVASHPFASVTVTR